MPQDQTTAENLSKLCAWEVEQNLDTLLIRLQGEFDLSCKERFEEQLSTLLGGRASTLIVDLRQLSFIDSTGLNALVRLELRAQEDGFDFAILCADGAVRRVFEETGLGSLLPIVDPPVGT